MRKISLRVLGVCNLVAFLALAAVPKAHADQGFYVLDKTARPGMLVSISKNPNVIEPASNEKASSLVGVLNGNPTSLSIEPGQVDVQTEGTSSALVTNLGGDIKVGDAITASSLLGFGSKLNGPGWIVGIAQASFDSHSNGAIKSSVADSAGVSHDVYVGNISVLIKVTYFNPGQATNPSSKSIVPDQLQSSIDSVAGRHASQIAVFLAFLLLLAGFVIAGFITNAAVKNAIKATARQPLAKSAILRRMVQSCGIAVAILGGAALGALVVIHIL